MPGSLSPLLEGSIAPGLVKGRLDSGMDEQSDRTNPAQVRYSHWTSLDITLTSSRTSPMMTHLTPAAFSPCASSPDCWKRISSGRTQPSVPMTPRNVLDVPIDWTAWMICSVENFVRSRNVSITSGAA